MIWWNYRVLKLMNQTCALNTFSNAVNVEWELNEYGNVVSATPVFFTTTLDQLTVRQSRFCLCRELCAKESICVFSVFFLFGSTLDYCRLFCICTFLIISWFAKKILSRPAMIRRMNTISACHELPPVTMETTANRRYVYCSHWFRKLLAR